MAESGRRVLVVTNMWPSAAAPWAGIFVREQVEALRAAAPEWDFEVLEIAGGRGRSDYLLAIPRVRRAARGRDLVHAHYGLTGATVAAARVSAPLVVTLHGSDVNIGWQRALSRPAVRRAAAVLAASERMRSLLGGQDVRVLPSGVDMDRFRPLERESARRRLGMAADRPVALFPAAPGNPLKGYELFQAAVAELPRQPAVEARTMGNVPREQVPALLCAVDVVVLTSRSEGSPMVVKEALACGTAVVGVDVGDVARLVGGLPGCAVVEREPAAIAAAVGRALGAKGAAARDARRRRNLELGLDSGSVARRVLGVYHQVLEG